MRRGKKESVSVWQNGKGGKIGLSTVSKDLSVDVCIVGAGIAGLTIGYLLAKEGKDVIIVDAWELGAGETSRTNAHLTSVLDKRFFELESLFGKEKTRLVAQSHSDAIDMIESIVKQEKIDCDFERVDGYLVALDEKQKKIFTKESDAIKQAGIVDREVLDEVTLKNVTIKNAIRVPSQAMFNIASYMLGLALAFEKLGGKIHNRTHVTQVKGGKITYAKTDGGFKIEAKHIVVATNTPINDWVKMHTKQAAYRTYVIAYEVPKRSYSGFLIWDMEKPYHYARIVRGNEEHDLLVIGGQDHKVGQENDATKRYHNLDNWAKKYFKILGPIKNQWSGQVMEAVDTLAFIGHNPGEEKNIYIVTGTSGNGITYGTIAGVLITDLIQGRENPWKEIYDPARKSLKSVGTYIEENANVVSCMVKDWVSASEVKNVSDIKAGEGAILRKGASKIAVYRDDKGELHERSAVCPHLGCIVQWNAGEKSWDCPCHGSRFDCCEGRILNGPAISRLAPIAKES